MGVGGRGGKFVKVASGLNKSIEAWQTGNAFETTFPVPKLGPKQNRQVLSMAAR